jgi:HopA1 effector protein family
MSVAATDSNACFNQAKAAILATAILSPTSYSWLDRESAPIPPRIKRAMTARTARNYLLHQLQSQLYGDFYVRGGASPRVWDDHGGAADAIAFAEGLSAANTGTGCHEGGWEVLAVAQREVVVRRDGITLWVEPEECLAPVSGCIEPGVSLRLRLPKELPHISPGYYMALGDHGDTPRAVHRLVRLYWNLRADGAETFVRSATRLLNGAGLFFRLKALNDPGSYTRCDAAVIYMRRDDYLAAVDTLGRIHFEVARHLKPGTPVFTKPIAAGLGLAEDPGQAESFGQHRCRILAEGIIHAHEQRVRSIDARLKLVTECFAAEGIALSQAYLSPNSVDIYRFGASTM